MKTPKLYLDTSIWNSAVTSDHPDFQRATLEFFNHARMEGWTLIISTTVLAEVQEAPQNKREKMLGLIEKIKPTIHTADEKVVLLADEYIEAGVLSRNHRNDCLHVACATLVGCDYLLSWNFKHLANFRRAGRFVAVNSSLGYDKKIWICNPLEVYEI